MYNILMYNCCIALATSMLLVWTNGNSIFCEIIF